MSVAVITPPEPFVELDLACKHLRVDEGVEDDIIELAIASACASIDGPGGWLGRAIGPQTLELRLEGFCASDWAWAGGYAWAGAWDDWTFWPFASRIRLPFPELISVVSITYEDGSGVDQVLSSDGWKSTGQGVEPAFASAWPSGRMDASAVRIRYEAGYQDVPKPLISAALLMAGDLYSNRLASVIEVGKGSAIENPTVERLLAPFRVYR